MTATSEALTGCDNGMAPRRTSVTAANQTLSVLVWGHETAPALVLLHGITSSAATWWRVGPDLARLGYRVYAFDMPGHGLSDSTDDHTLPALARLLNTACAELGLGEITLIGHSWGGATAMHMALEAERPAIRQLVLVDPSMGMAPWWGESALPAYLEGVGEPPEVTLPRLRAKNPSWHPCDFLWKGEAYEQCRPDAVRGFFTASGIWELAPRLGETDMPLLLLVADAQYTVISPEMLEQARAALRPGLGELVMVPGTDHNMLRGGFVPTMAVLQGWLNPRD